MKISVIVPLHNSSKFITETIESLIQSKNHIEQILFIDNDSKDETLRIVKNVLVNQRIDYRIMINSRNFGISNAMKKGLYELSKKTGYIMRLDHDDVVSTDYIRSATKYLKYNPDVGLVCPQIRTFQFTPSISNEVGSELVFMHDDRDKFIHLFNKNSIPASGSIYNSRILKKYFYDSKNDWANDWELSLHIALKHSIKQLKDEFIYYRTGIDSLSSKFSDSSKDIFYFFMRSRILSRIYFEKHFRERKLLETLYSQSSWMHERFPLSYLGTKSLISKILLEDGQLSDDYRVKNESISSFEDGSSIKILNHLLTSNNLTKKTKVILFYTTYFKSVDSNSYVLK